MEMLTSGELYKRLIRATAPDLYELLDWQERKDEFRKEEHSSEFFEMADRREEHLALRLDAKCELIKEICGVDEEDIWEDLELLDLDEDE